MSSETDPIVGIWYQRLDKGQEFQVVAVDEETGSVEMQHFDGDLEEMDLETWHQLDLVAIEEPENWSGPLDVGELDDLTGTEVTDTAPEEWTEPLDELVKSEDRPTGAATQEDADDWGEGYPEEEPLVQEPAAELAEESATEGLPNAGTQAWSED